MKSAADNEDVRHAELAQDDSPLLAVHARAVPVVDASGRTH
jgi:hypothetical protein